MKIAVTGASGFIGRHVVNALLNKGVEVMAITRSAAGLSGCDKRVAVVETDIFRPSSDSFNLLGCPDVLIHLAWGGLPNYRALSHFETELPRQYVFLKKMVESGLASLTAAGTCFEYGMQSGKLSETMPPAPSNPYGFAKDALHRQLEFLKKERPFELTWGRIFYTYGEGQSKESLYPQLQDAVRRGERIFNMSGGEQVRDYLPVEEIARLVVELAMKRAGIGTVNICSGQPVRLRSLIEQWLKTKGWNIELNPGFYPYPDYEPMAFWGDRQYLDECLKQK